MGSERPISAEDAWGAAQRKTALIAAARLAVAHGNRLSDVSIDHWANAYRLGSEDVRQAFDMALSRDSLTPTYCDVPEGK